MLSFCHAQVPYAGAMRDVNNRFCSVGISEALLAEAFLSGAAICNYWEMKIGVEICGFVRVTNLEIGLAFKGLQPGLSWTVGERISLAQKATEVALS